MNKAITVNPSKQTVSFEFIYDLDNFTFRTFLFSSYFGEIATAQ